MFKGASPEEFKTALEKQKVRFLPDVRRDRKRPNLGRDRRGHHDIHHRRLPPLPDIFEQATSAEDLQALYREHAFKFFHGPSAVINTLTKIETPKGITVNDSRFKKLIREASSFATEWQRSGAGREMSDSSTQALQDSIRFMGRVPAYIQHEPRNAFKRPLFFMKTVMGAGELIRRLNPQNGQLGLGEFEAIIELRDREIERARKEGRSTTYLPMDFSGEESNKAFDGSSVVHINAKELPMALMAVEYMRQQHLQEKNKK